MDDTSKLGQELLRVHGQLRARVSALESALDDDTDIADLRGSCLAFCRGLRRHHLGEDNGAFGVLRRHEPELGDTLDALMRDHEFLDPMLDRVEQLLNGDPGPCDRIQIQREVAGIAAVLENHLAYEERVLVSVLDALDEPAVSVDGMALRAPLDGIFDPEP